MGDGPLNLHAWRLTFTHPAHGELVSLEAPPPVWSVSQVAVGRPDGETPVGRVWLTVGCVTIPVRRAMPPR
jgi:hypothetical protein